MEGLKALYQTRSDDLKKKRKKYESEAVVEAKSILENVNRTIEKVVREIKESQAASDIIKKGRNEIRGLTERINQMSDIPERPVLSVDSLKLGQLVRSRRFSVTGQITKILKEKKQIEIDATGVKLTLPVSDIFYDEDVNNEMVSEIRADKVSPDVINEIDLRGKIAEDALIELEQYLDHALNSEWHEIRIIHGKGTGVLRSNVHAFLKRNKKIKSYRLGNYGEGDTGVTIIEL
jgi:DNA mismatch repair protein MutS2